MEKELLLQVYNPSNLKNLKEEEIAAMQVLTDEQLKQLAEAYPNKATQVPYLKLRDTGKADREQLYPLSTWQNLVDLRNMGQKNFVAGGVSGKESPGQNTPVAAPQDISRIDALNVPGLQPGSTSAGPGLNPDGTARTAAPVTTNNTATTDSTANVQNGNVTTGGAESKAGTTDSATGTTAATTPGTAAAQTGNISNTGNGGNSDEEDKKARTEERWQTLDGMGIAEVKKLYKDITGKSGHNVKKETMMREIIEKEIEGK